MVVDGLWNGGAERQMTLLASSLPEGWSASVASLEDGPYRSVLEGLGVETHVVPRRFRLDPTPVVRLWRLAVRARPDVVHSWGWMSTLAALPYCRAYGVPLVSGSIRHGCVPRRRANIDKLSVRLADAVIANSRSGLAAYGVPEGDRGRVVYNGFEFGRFERASPPADSSLRDGTTVIMAARMFLEKDWRLLFTTARSLSREAQGWRFLAVGDGPDRDALMADSADLVNAGVVEFPHGGLEVLPLIASADIGVLLTDPVRHEEGCSNSIMEYMACGLAVVATESGGTPEIVEDGVTGVLIPAHDADALSEALRALRDDPARSRAMGQAGRRSLEQRFTVEQMVSGFVSAYESLLQTG